MKNSNFKCRLLIMLIFICIIGSVSYFNKPITVTVNEKGACYEEKTIKNELVQNIKMQYNKPKNIKFKLGNISNGNNYNVKVKHGKKVVGSTELPDKNIDSEYIVNIDIDGEHIKKGDELSLIISTKETSDLNILTVVSNKNNFQIDNLENNEELYYSIEYNGFTETYFYILLMLTTVVLATIFFINMKSIHNSMFIIILVLGLFSAVLNPVLDIPDEHDHISRADLASRGYLMMGEDYKDYRISNAIGVIIDNNWSTFENTTLTDTKADWNTNSVYYSYANANLFLGYIPQTVGIILSKFLGVNNYGILLIGRIMNLIMYAVIVRYALKKTPMFKIPLAIVSIFPMSLFIAASYNPDATTYALGILAISYFLYIYDKKCISIKNIFVYFIICTILGLVKLPYCLLIGLLLFIPKDRYDTSKTYYKSILFIAIVAIISLGWAGISVIRTKNSPFQAYFDAYGVNSREQVMYIINNPITFIKGFIISLGKNLSGYINQLTEFGWLLYGMPKILKYAFNIFLIVVIIGYPSKVVLSKKTIAGISLVSLGVYVCTCLTLYITWTTVGANTILGVQGRYFIPVIGMLSLICPYRISCSEKKREIVDYIFLCVGILFAALYLLTVTNQYY